MEVKYKNKIYNTDIVESDGYCQLADGGHASEIKGFAAGVNIVRVFNGSRWVSVYCADDESKYYAWIEGRQFVFDKPKEEEKSYGAEDTDSGDRQPVFAPMPGSIVKVLVEKGQKVTEGQPLIIVEAMKMETTLYSSIDGCVTELNARQGEQVNTDRILILIEKENINS